MPMYKKIREKWIKKNKVERYGEYLILYKGVTNFGPSLYGWNSWINKQPYLPGTRVVADRLSRTNGVCTHGIHLVATPDMCLEYGLRVIKVLVKETHLHVPYANTRKVRAKEVIVDCCMIKDKKTNMWVVNKKMGLLMR